MSKIFKAKDRYGAETEFCIADIGILESNEADLDYKIPISGFSKGHLLILVKEWLS